MSHKGVSFWHQPFIQVKTSSQILKILKHSNSPELSHEIVLMVVNKFKASSPLNFAFQIGYKFSSGFKNLYIVAIEIIIRLRFV